ncbi:hypothetical protein ACIHFC_23860 [Streptomyces sp. NPDC052013]|uniref:hypothetical protein n=1 Tax=Streptomyces sp. NPDC052013 TaxID=3365679 RepID=UPI0037D55EFA
MKKRAIGVLAAAALAVAAPVLTAPSAYAGGSIKCSDTAKMMVTTNSMTPVRADYSSKARIITHLGAGYRLHVIRQCVNSAGNLWYFTDKPYQSGWIYSGNLRNA